VKQVLGESSVLTDENPTSSKWCSEWRARYRARISHRIIP